MLAKNALLFLSILTGSGNAMAQKVIRKGMPPIDVSKNKRRPIGVTPEFNTLQFLGKWQEVGRVDQNKQPVDFTDTSYLNFLKPNRVLTRDGKSATLAGDAAITQGNILMAAGDVYTIITVNDSIAVLDDQDEFVRTFQKKTEFYFESFGKQTVKKEVFTNPISVMLEDIKGKWRVYRKDAKPGAINPPVNIIQYLNIIDSTGENTATGEVTFYQKDKSIQMLCTIKVTNAGIDITAGENSWQLFIYKANKKDLVFGDAEVLLYHAKLQ